MLRRMTRGSHKAGQVRQKDSAGLVRALAKHSGKLYDTIKFVFVRIIPVVRLDKVHRGTRLVGTLGRT